MVMPRFVPRFDGLLYIRTPRQKKTFHP